MGGSKKITSQQAIYDANWSWFKNVSQLNNNTMNWEEKNNGHQVYSKWDLIINMPEWCHQMLVIGKPKCFLMPDCKQLIQNIEMTKISLTFITRLTVVLTNLVTILGAWINFSWEMQHNVPSRRYYSRSWLHLKLTIKML